MTDHNFHHACAAIAALLSSFLLMACAAAEPRVATPSRSTFLSEAISARDLVFLSGQLGMETGANTDRDSGIEGETRRALQNLSAAAERAGVRLADAARVEVYLTDMSEYASMNAVYTEFFPAPAPARTCIGVAALPRGGRVEIAATVERR
jgi:2-iminobutanoate/2-iminopropanoate deaminase